MRTFTRLTILTLLVLLGGRAAHAELRIGDAAPALPAREWIHGEAVAVPSHTSTCVVTFWWASDPPSGALLRELDRLQTVQGKTGVEMVGLVLYDSKEAETAAREFVAGHRGQIRGAIALAPAGGVLRGYLADQATDQLPVTFVVARNRRIAWVGHPLDGMKDIVEKVARGVYDIDTARRVDDVKRAINRAESYREMLSLFDRWSQLVPDDPTPMLVKMQTLLYDMRNPEGAIDAAKHAIAIARSQGAAAMLDVVYWIADARDYDEMKSLARATLDEASRLGGQGVDTDVMRVEILATLDQLVEATRLAERTAQKITGKPELLSRMAYAVASQYEEGRHNPLALRLIEQAISARPTHLPYHDLRFFIAAYCVRDMSRVAEVGDDVIRVASGDAPFLDEFAWRILDQVGVDDVPAAPPVAVKASRAACELTKYKEWTYLETLAVALYTTGDHDGARDAIRAAIKICKGKDETTALQKRLASFGPTKKDASTQPSMSMTKMRKKDK